MHIEVILRIETSIRPVWIVNADFDHGPPLLVKRRNRSAPRILCDKNTMCFAADARLLRPVVRAALYLVRCQLMKALKLAPLALFPLLVLAQQTDFLKDLKFRQIGPFRGGRSVAVTGVPSQPDTYYFGAVGGGVFKTTDSGLSWAPVSDGQFKTGSVGALAVADSDANAIYAGMGEACVRGNATHGDGVYKSVDAGRTWRNIGLEDSYHIGAVRVHPKNPDIVYVAALGHLWGPNEMRGVYRTMSGFFG